MTREEHLKEIERERREREEALLLLLLALSERSRVNVNRALRVGGDWLGMLEGVLFGNQALDLPGGIEPVSRVMADTYLAGYQRAGKLADVTLEPPLTIKQAAVALKDAAVESMQRVYGYLRGAVTKALGTAAPVDRISADVAAVSEAFDKAGFSPASKRGAQVETTRLVIGAYNAGLGAGYRVPLITGQMTGLVFVNPLDARTTTICRKRAGTILPSTDPWWNHNWPPLHDGCRSLAMPLFRAFVPTARPPEFPLPEPGWGDRHPGWVLQIDRLVSDYRKFYGVVQHDPLRI